jgi:glycerol kinase
MRSVLAIDQGTTGSTCLVVSVDGRVLGRGYREIPQHYPHPGWVEHEPQDLLSSVVAAARDALAQAKGEPPVAIGITNQRETIVLWDRATGKPVHKAIVWQDRRTADRCAALRHESDRIARRTGLVTDPYFSGTKLEWLLAQGDNRRRAEAGELAAGTVDTWLMWCLSGGAVHATDPTNASRTMLYDIDAQAWSDELLGLFGIPRRVLPEVRRSSGIFGMSRGDVLGLEAPIAGVAGDQQSALFGQGCVSAGEAKNTYGTGAFLLLNCGATRPAGGGGLLTTVACDATGGAAYALEGAIFIAGAAVQWLRDGLGLIATASETEALAESVADTGGVVFVPALTGLGAPDWEPRARGTITGLTRGTTKAHLVRAALEAMAHGTADVLTLMRERSGVPFATLRVDGGASANNWLMQRQADLLGVPVERPANVETTALGAAGLAGLATGVWGNAAEFAQATAMTRFAPKAAAADVATDRREWRRAVGAALAWARDVG